MWNNERGLVVISVIHAPALLDRKRISDVNDSVDTVIVGCIRVHGVHVSVGGGVRERQGVVVHPSSLTLLTGALYLDGGSSSNCSGSNSWEKGISVGNSSRIRKWSDNIEALLLQIELVGISRSFGRRIRISRDGLESRLARHWYESNQRSWSGVRGCWHGVRVVKWGIGLTVLVHIDASVVEIIDKLLVRHN